MLHLIAALVVSASLMPPGKQAYVDANGAPLAGGRVYTYAAGTSTPLATYSDRAGTIPNTNPVILDARGEATIFWAPQGYKVVLRDAADVTIWTQDDLFPPVTHGSDLDGALAIATWDGVLVGSASARSTGSTTDRTLNGRFADEVNALDYGAWCDFDVSTATGHDDTTALRAALTAAAGRVLYIPASRTGRCCMVSNSLRPASGTTIRGDGYGSCIVTKPGGWHYGIELPSTIDYGNITLYGVNNVRITGLRLRGAKDTPDTAWEYSPDVIQLTNVNNITIDHNFIENTHYSALWSGGNAFTNDGLIFDSNYVYDCGYIQQSDALGHGGGGVIQYNGNHGVFTSNIFKKVGFGISATGPHSVVSGNTFEDFQGDAVFCAGDSRWAEGCVVTGNSFHSAPNLIPGGVGIYTPTAVYVSNSLPGYSQYTRAKITNNSMNFVIDNTNARARCVDVSGIDATVQNNDCIFDVQIDTSTVPANYYGFLWEASNEWGPTIKAEGNTVWAFTSNNAPNFALTSRIMAFALAPNVQKIKVESRHNTVDIPANSFAWEYYYSTPGHHFSTKHFGDISTSGNVRIGQTFYPQRGVSFTLAFDSELSSSVVQKSQAFPGVPVATPATVVTPVVMNSDGTISKTNSLYFNHLAYQASMDLDASVAWVHSIEVTNSSAYAFNAPINAVEGQTLVVRIKNSSGGAIHSGDPFPASMKHSAWTAPASATSTSVTFVYENPVWIEVARSVDVPN